MYSDLRSALKQFVRDGATSLGAIISLALGIGISASIFAIGAWLVSRPVPGVRHPDRVAIVWFGQESASGGFSISRLSYPNHLRLDRQLTSLDTLIGYQQSAVNVGRGKGTAKRVRAEFVTHSYFAALGVLPEAGRFFTADEDRPSAPQLVSVLSQGLSDQMFPANRSAARRDSGPVGQELTINGLRTVVIGTVPDRFRGLERFGDTDVWLPGASLYTLSHRTMPDDGHAGFYQWFGRLKAGSTFAEAQAELTVETSSLADGTVGNQKFAEGTIPRLFAGAGLFPLDRERVTETLRILWIAAGLLMLVACINVANLSLVRGMRRQHSRAVRRALGATTARVARCEVLESGLFAVVGASFGLLLAWYVTRLFSFAVVPGLNRELGAVAVDLTAVLFGFGLSLAVALLCGVVPALVATRRTPFRYLSSGASDGPPGSQRSFDALCVAQLSSAIVLLVCGSLFFQALRELERVDLGFDSEGVSVFSSTPRSQNYGEEEAARYFDDLIRGLSELPGVEALAVATSGPFQGGFFRTRVYPAGSDPDGASVNVLRSAVSPDYFRALRIPVMSGRGFGDRSLVSADGRG